MGTRPVRTRAGQGHWLWLLLFLLPQSPRVGTAPRPGVFSSSKAPGVTPGSRGPHQDGESVTRSHQYPASRPQVCGKPKMMGKIFGGQDTLAGQWPWQASLLYHGLHLCGAVLIDSRWVVSTAHCFQNISQAPENYQVLLGNTQLYQQTQHTQKIPVNRIINHPDFEKFHPFGSDVAMLQLRLPVNFTSHVIPACLPTKDTRLPSHTPCWITGWGMLSEDMTLLPPFSLQEGEVVLIENEFCNILYGRRPGEGQDYVHEDMLCAGGLSTGKSICRGDSGGPLTCYHNSTWVLVGLASWGPDCRSPVYPSIFTRVAYFTDWISQVKRLTPLPEPVSVSPHSEFPPRLPVAAASPQPRSILIVTQTWSLLQFILRASQKARG